PAAVLAYHRGGLLGAAVVDVGDDYVGAFLSKAHGHGAAVTRRCPGNQRSFFAQSHASVAPSSGTPLVRKAARSPLAEQANKYEYEVEDAGKKGKVGKAEASANATGRARRVGHPMRGADRRKPAAGHPVHL